ncbi:NAD-dependent epimerase/dehydratase family protein [Candidatus Nitrosopelagicus sp.]|nr:NAD-dependent epimerase/dehydratase family protein [Candidatus Nitrosopelagicus sp.]
MNKIIEDDINSILDSSIPWKRFQGKSILITGATGMIPSYMVFTLLTLNKILPKKSKIFVLVKNKTKAKKLFKNYLSDSSLKIIHQDVVNKININTKINYIIHGASPADPTKYTDNPIDTLLPNIIGTKNLLDISNHENFNAFLFLSSGAVYGNLKQKTIRENNFGSLDPLDPRSCYAESKRMGENMCVSWFTEKNTPVKIARIFHTYGPTMNLDDGRIFASLVSDVIKNKNLSINSNGKTERPFCYIVDTVTAMFTILLKGKTGEAYNISNPSQTVSVNKLAKTIVDIFPEKKLKIIKRKSQKNKQTKNLITTQYPDICKIKRLGWNPKFSIKHGFSRTILSFLEN